MVSEGLSEIRQLQDEVNKDIRAHFRNFAQNVATESENDPLTLVVGRRQTGKTNSLIPEIKTKLTADGFRNIVIDASFYLSVNEVISKVPDDFGENCVVIIDEPGVLSIHALDTDKSQGEIKTLINTLNQRNIHILPVFTCSAEPALKNDVLDLMDIWQEASPRQGKIFDMDTVSSISPELVSKLLTSKLFSNQKRSEFMENKIPDLIMSLVPANLCMLSLFQGCTTEDGVIDAISNYKSTIFNDDFLSRADQDALNIKLQQKYGFKFKVNE